jgi:hypothetical protein
MCMNSRATKNPDVGTRTLKIMYSVHLDVRLSETIESSLILPILFVMHEEEIIVLGREICCIDCRVRSCVRSTCI